MATKEKQQYNFDDSIKVGRMGEMIMEAHLKTLPNVAAVEDVTEIPYYQKRDIDYRVTLKNGQKVTVEVKTDTYQSGNFFFETQSNSNSKTKGCMYKTEADFILYYFILFDKVYMVKRTALIKWFEAMKGNPEYKKSFKEKSVANKGNERIKDYHTYGFTFPIQVFEETMAHYRKDEEVRKKLEWPKLDLGALIKKK